MNLWRIEEDRPRPLVAAGIDEEKRLESILADDIRILGLGSLMLLGRQVLTDHGARIDLLALDEGGTLDVIELKRTRTPREVVAQVLDYGSWARSLSAESLARIFESGPFAQSRTFHTAFADHFDGPPPETINESHRLVIVASQLDDSEPFSSCGLAGLKDVDGLGQLPGAPGAAAELAQDVPVLELGVGALAGGS
jgi:hypothetical protein